MHLEQFRLKRCQRGNHHWDKHNVLDSGPLQVGDQKYLWYKVCLNCGATYLAQPVYAGTLVQATLNFYNLSNQLTDPSTISLIIKPGSVADIIWTYAGAQLTRQSQGVYLASLDTTPGVLGTPGSWTLQGQGTGTCIAVNVTGFTVTAPPL